MFIVIDVYSDLELESGDDPMSGNRQNSHSVRKHINIKLRNTHTAKRPADDRSSTKKSNKSARLSHESSPSHRRATDVNLSTNTELTFGLQLSICFNFLFQKFPFKLWLDSSLTNYLILMIHYCYFAICMYRNLFSFIRLLPNHCCYTLYSDFKADCCIEISKCNCAKTVVDRRFE